MAEPFITIRRGSQYSDNAETDGAQMPASNGTSDAAPTSPASNSHRRPRPVSIENCPDGEDSTLPPQPQPNQFAANGYLNTGVPDNYTFQPHDHYQQPSPHNHQFTKFMSPVPDPQGYSHEFPPKSPPSPTAFSPVTPHDNGEQPFPEPFHHYTEFPIEGTRRSRGHKHRKSSFLGPSPLAIQGYGPVPINRSNDAFSPQNRRPSDSHGSWGPIQPMPNYSPQPSMLQPTPLDQNNSDAIPDGWSSSPVASHGHPVQHPFASPCPAPRDLAMVSPKSSQDARDPPRGMFVWGYQEVALHLAGEMGDSRIVPIYRRFATLNHRFLLHTQDELSVLEEELERLDFEDARDPNEGTYGYPASRRAKGKCGPARDELMKSVGLKLEQYRQMLAAFNEMQEYFRPTDGEIGDYRRLLERDDAPIAMSEAAFIRQESDLLCLPTYLTRSPKGEISGMPPSPIQSDITTNTTRSKSGSDPAKAKRIVHARSRTLLTAAYVTFAAILAPMLTFFVIPNFLGRMLIILVAIGGVSAVLMSSGMLRGSDNAILRDYFVCAGVYGGIMAVLAGIC